MNFSTAAFHKKSLVAKIHLCMTRLTKSDEKKKKKIFLKNVMVGAPCSHVTVNGQVVNHILHPPAKQLYIDMRCIPKLALQPPGVLPHVIGYSKFRCDRSRSPPEVLWDI